MIRYRQPVSKVAVRLAIAAILTCAVASRASAQQDQYQVKAAFLINFLKFIDWPDKSGPYVIEVVGKNPFGAYLEGLSNNRLINGRKVIVRMEKSGASSKASIIFVPASETDRYSEFLQYATKPVIVIGETPGFARRFGAINFILDHDRVAFEVNPKIAKGGNVKISSRLLQLAKIVE